MKTDVLDFILHFNTPMHECREKFLHGQCYWFAKILMARFYYYPGVLYYNQVLNHFALEIQGILYDAAGATIRTDNDGWVPWDYYKSIEPNDSYRVLRDCVLQLPSETPEEELKKFLHKF